MIPRSLTLSLDVFIQCGKNDFDEEGLKTFKSFIYNKDLVNVALAAHRVAGEGIVRKTVHKGSITFAVHVKEDIPAGILLAGGQNEMLQYMGALSSLR